MKRNFFASLPRIICGLVCLNGFSQAAVNGDVPQSPGAFLGAPSGAPTVAADDKGKEIERLWEAGQKKEAQRELKTWTKEEKGSPWPLVVGAKLSFKEERYKRCLSLAEKALKKSPTLAEAFYWRGRAYEALKRPLEAANEYQAALRVQSVFSEAQEGLNRTLNQLGSTAGEGSYLGVR